MAQVHQAAQGFTDAEWDDILARVAADEDLVQRLQAGEKYSEEDLPRKLVELVNQRKKLFAQQRAEAKRNKPMTPAQQKAYMVKEIFKTTMRRVQSFMPMDFELEDKRIKRAEMEIEAFKENSYSKLTKAEEGVLEASSSAQKGLSQGNLSSMGYQRRGRDVSISPIISLGEDC
ncbi:hypothetical protein Tco_0960139 [Tanacetum coccineum]